MIRIFFLILIPYFSHGLSFDQIDKLLHDANPILLNQFSFDSGTFRIKAGGYYLFVEDVEFNPLEEFEIERIDKPVSGWFALISIETDQPVVIDLGGHTICSSAAYDMRHPFNVFALIELGNSPFSGVLFGFPNPHQSFVNYKGDFEYVSASHVIIKNGVLGRSGHWGIHGNNNSHIYLHDLVIKDWEVRGIELNGLVHGCIRNIEISGLEHSLNSTVQLAGALQVKEVLKGLCKQRYKDADVYLARLEKWLDEHDDFAHPVHSLPTGTVGGVFIAGGGVSNSDFPVNASGCAYAMNLSGGRIATDVTLENIFIHDLAVNAEQKAAIGSRQSGPDGSVIRIEHAGLLPGGSLLWCDAYNEIGEFDPNPILMATVFTMQAAIQHNPLIKKKLPLNFDLIAQSILSKNHLLFLNNVQPVYTYPSHKIKGLFGVRLDGVADVTVNNCRVHNICNRGEPVLELHQLPDGNHYLQDSYSYKEYRGCDIWGFECAASKNCIFIDCTAERVISSHGNAFGFELIVDTQNILIDHCRAIEIIAAGDIIFSHLNLPSEAYGFRVQDTQGSNSIKNCLAQIIESPRRSFGFGSERAKGTEFDSCIAEKIRVTSNVLSLEKEKQKVSFGFSSEGSHKTIIRNCRVANAVNEGTKQRYDGSIVAGFAFTENDSMSVLFNSTSEQLYNDTGAVLSIYTDEDSDRPMQGQASPELYSGL